MSERQELILIPKYEKLKTGTYKHSGYSEFFVTEPKLRRIEKSKYILVGINRKYVFYALFIMR